MTQKFNLVLGRVENIVGKGTIAGYHHYSPFPTILSKYQEVSKAGIVW